MANLSFTANTYAGSKAQGIFAKLLLEADSVERGLITVIQGVKHKKVLRKIDDSIEFKNYSAVFSPQTAAPVLDEKVLTLVKYGVYREIDFESLRTSWEAEEMKSGTQFDHLPTAEMQSFLLEYMTKLMKKAHESLYWTGKANTPEATFSAPYTGILPTALASSSTVKLDLSEGVQNITNITQANPAVITVASTADINVGDYISITGVVGMTQINGLAPIVVSKTATTLTTSIDASGFSAYVSGGTVKFINRTNVISVLSGLFSRVSDQVLKSPNFKFYIPLHVEKAFRLAIADAANGSGAYYVGDRMIDFLGAKLEAINSWQPNIIMATHSSNLFLGVDLLDEEMSLDIVDMSKSNADKTIRFRCDLKSDTKIMYDEEVFLARPA